MRRYRLVLFMPLLAIAACGAGSPDDAGGGGTTSENTPAPADPLPGKLFVDPQGTYSITIANGWTEIPGAFVKEIEAWGVADPADGFTGNVNVLTQDALGNDLAEYLDLTVNNLGGLELIDRRTVTGTNGNELGLLEYKGALPGAPTDRVFHVLQTIDIGNGNAIVATLTALEVSFDTYRSGVEPFLLTLQAT